MTKGYLILETGEVFSGTLIGSEKDSTGEVVFNTSMTGYQEIMSDPSYAGQIIVFCYPLIGNYGFNPAGYEGDALHLKGVIMGKLVICPIIIPQKRLHINFYISLGLLDWQMWIHESLLKLFVTMER